MALPCLPLRPSPKLLPHLFAKQPPYSSPPRQLRLRFSVRLCCRQSSFRCGRGTCQFVGPTSGQPEFHTRRQTSGHMSNQCIYSLPPKRISLLSIASLDGAAVRPAFDVAAGFVTSLFALDVTATAVCYTDAGFRFTPLAAFALDATSPHALALTLSLAPSVCLCFWWPPRSPGIRGCCFLSVARLRYR